MNNKRQIGGYQIIDLRDIGLTVGTVPASITDANILAQLLPFRDHIDKDYDFSKPLEDQLKPVLIRFRDQKNGEKIEGATFGEFSVDGNYYTFKITARISGFLMLIVSVAFEEITNDYGAKEWVIDTATVLLKDESKTIEGDLALTGNLSVGGLTTLSGGIVTGNVSADDVTVGDDLTVTDDASVGGDLTVTGNAQIFEKIADSDGNKRFVEGSLETRTIAGVTYTYNKWSLSGTHLMIVLAGNIEAETTIADSTTLAEINLPHYIADKIVQIAGDVVSLDSSDGYSADFLTTSEIKTSFWKYNTLFSIKIRGGAYTSPNANIIFRIQYDLLIDNA